MPTSAEGSGCEMHLAHAALPPIKDWLGKECLVAWLSCALAPQQSDASFLKVAWASCMHEYHFSARAYINGALHTTLQAQNAKFASAPT